MKEKWLKEIVVAVTHHFVALLSAMQAIQMIDADLKRAKQGDFETPAVCIVRVKLNEEEIAERSNSHENLPLCCSLPE